VACNDIYCHNFPGHIGHLSWKIKHEVNIFYVVVLYFQCIEMCYRPELVPVEKETEVVLRLVIVLCLYNCSVCLYWIECRHQRADVNGTRSLPSLVTYRMKKGVIRYRLLICISKDIQSPVLIQGNIWLIRVYRKVAIKPAAMFKMNCLFTRSTLPVVQFISV